MADVILTTSDLKQVRKLLYPIRRKWYDIGLELDINVGDLDTIKATCSDPGECLTEMVKMWLKSITSSPAWKSLGDALKADFVNELELAQKAYGKQSNLSPERDAAPHSDLATQRNQDDSNIEDNSCPSSSSSMASLFPDLKANGKLSEYELSLLRERLYDETTKLQTRFASLMLSVQKDLEKTVKTEDIISFLVFRNKKLVERLDNCTRIPQVFRKMIQFTSFFDYDLLEDLIEEFGSATVREKLKEYLGLFEVFSKRRVFECPINAFGNAEETEKVWVLKTDKIIEDLTVEELKRYVYKISKILDNKLTCVLRVEKGCVKLTFKSLEDDWFDISEEQIQALYEIGIMNISYGDRSIDTRLECDLAYRDWEKALDSLRLERVDLHTLHKGDTPLHAYIRHDSKEKLNSIMTLLINAQCDVNDPNEEGDSPLHLACGQGDLLPAKALIALDADINQLNTQNQTPLDLALPKSSALADILISIGGLKGEEFMLRKLLKEKPIHMMDIVVRKEPGQREASLPSTSENREMDDDKQIESDAYDSNDFLEPDSAASKVQTSSTSLTCSEAAPRLKKGLFLFQNPKSSAIQSTSSINPNMLILESMLGQSVRSRKSESERRRPRYVGSDIDPARSPVLLRKPRKNKKGHRILCLDGGVVKPLQGLVQIEILKKIEELAGAPITELFDWIVGTSTGGIITLGTVYGKKSLEDLRKVYFEMNNKVFKKNSTFLTTTVYDTEALEALLKKTLGTDTKMCDEEKPKVLITAVDKSSRDLPLVFFNNCFNDKLSIQEVWKVARYTSALPGFLKELDNYIDGGVIANNPCNFALTHIKQHLKQSKQEQKDSGMKPTISTDFTCLVSVGCGIFPPDPLDSFTNISQLPTRMQHIATMLATAMTKSEDQANICRSYCEELEIPFFRFSPQVDEQIATAETDDMKLCNSIISVKKLLYENQDHLEELIKFLLH